MTNTSAATTLFDHLARHAEQLADKTAFSYIEDNGDLSCLSFAQLDQQVNDLAKQLAVNTNQGDRVVLLLPQGMDYVVTFLACLRAGRVAVPLYPPLSRNQSGRVVKVVADCDAQLVITNQRLFESVNNALEQQISGLMCVNQLSEQMVPDVELPALAADDLAFLQYTSGSTGTPKGVMITHTNILANLQSLIDATNCNQQDVFCNWLPLFHDLGLINTLLLPAFLGAHSVLMSPARFVKRPAVWFEAIDNYRATICGAPNFAYDLCVKRLKTDKLTSFNLSSWRHAFTAAEPIDSDTLASFERKFAAIGFKPSAWLAAYGMAEATVFISANKIRSSDGVLSFDSDLLHQQTAKISEDAQVNAQKLVSCGRATPQHQLIIVDPKTLMPLPQGQVGEIWFAGPSVSIGYWQDQAKTQASFNCAFSNQQGQSSEAKYLRTGDAGFMHNGELFISGRLKDILIINGRNYYPQDIEKTSFESHEALVDFASVAFEHKGQVVLVQEVARKFLRQLDDDNGKIEQLLCQQIFEQFDVVVSDVVLLRAGQLPRTSSGKVQRSLTSQLYLAGELTRLNQPNHTLGKQAGIALQTDSEQRLGTIWCELLAVENVYTNDNFFALGGQSVTALYLTERIFTEFAVELAPRVLFEYPELAELAAFIDGQTKVEADNVNSECSTEYLSTKYLASNTQRQIWLEQQMAPNSSRYHLVDCFELNGAIDVTRLQQALGLLVANHGILRTCYQQTEQGLQAQIQQGDFDVLTVLPATDAAMDDFKARPFDLTKDIPLRAGLFLNAEERATLLIVGHHIAMDGGSYQRLIKDLNCFYQQGAIEVAANNDDFAQLVQLSQHSVAQHELTTAKNYWQQQLADLPLTHNLPMDYARAPSSNVDFRGDSYHLTLDSQLVTQLEQLAQSRNLSWFSLMHSAIAVLLRRHSGDDEVVLGITFDNRSAKARDIVGYFVNTLVTRSHIDFNTSFDDLLQTTFQQLTQAYAHSQLSFDALVELLNPPRVAGLNPLFQVLVGYDDSEQPELELAGVTATRVELPTEQVMTDLALHILRKSQSTQIRFDFATRLFKRETIENMANRLVVLLEAIVKTPEANVDQLPLLSASDKTALAPEHDKIADVELLIERFQRQVAANPQQVALSVTAQDHSQSLTYIELTYLELDTAANRLAHYLIAQGVQREDRVAVCLNRRADLVVALLAIIKAGGAYVPLDASYPAERLSYMLTDADAKLVLTESDIDAALFSGCSKQVVLLDTLTQLDHFSQTSEGLPAIEPQQLAYVIYTSGSTGKPKGVMIEHRNVAALIEWAGNVYDSQALSKVLAVTSICFDLSVFELFVPLCHGGSVVLVKDALAVNADIAVSLVNTVPSVAKTWLATNALPKSAKIVNLAGELLAQSVVDSLYQQGVAKVYDLYGPSEDTTYSTYALRKINGRNTIGQAIAGTQALLLNSQGQMVPKGVVGELHLAGAGLARGYLNQPQLSAERFVIDEQVLGGRRYRTGDLMRIDGDGQLQYIGRNEHLVKIRGFRIELGEVEACIRRFAGIKDVVVIADSQAQQLAAYVVADGDELQGSLLQQLQQHLKQHLPNFMIPGDIIVLPHLPLTPNGKVDRSALPKATFRATFQSGEQHQIKAPQNPLEQQLLSIWQQLFDKQEISTDDNLFAIGGHSLLAAKMAWQISQQLKLNVGLDVVMAQQTIATQAQYLAELATNDSVEQWQKPDDAPLVLSAAQRRLWLIDNIEAEPSVRAQYNMPLALNLTGDLQLTALNAALNDLIKRYPVLRSRITTSVDGEPQLSYYTDSTIELTVDEHADSEKWLNQQLSKPFDLSQDLLIRANVLALSANEHLLVLCVHHIVADGHSFNRLTEELTHLYKQQLYRQQPLAEVHSHYHDYVYVEAQHEQDNSKALDYWRQQLADLPQVHNLPLDFPRPVKALHQAGYHYQALAVDVTDKLKAVAQHHNQSLFTLIQSAFACVLARHSGQDDIVMGTPVLNRQDARWADTLGFFADTQILRTRLPQNATFSELMTQNSLWLQQCLGEHRLTYDKLVDELAPERSLAFNPLFQILIVMQPQVEVELAGLEVTKLQPKTGVGKYDLTLTISQEKDQLQLSWEYDSGLFKTATIERMAGHLAVMLAAVADQPNMPIAQLPLLTANEQTQLQQWLTGQALQQPVGLLHQRFEQQAEATPNHIAVYHGDKDSFISYGELNRRANQLAHRLIADGVTPDTAVIICLDRQLALAVAVLAVLKAGGAYVAVDPNYPQSRIEHIIDDAGASFTITEQSYTEQSYQALVNVNHCYLVDKPCWLNADEHNPEITALKPNHLAYMIYTSGSTGRPKGVMIEHQNAHAMVSWAQRVFDDSELACVLASTSMCFDLSIYEWFVPLSSGYSLALVDDALALTQAEFNLPITLINTVPSAIKALLDADAIPASVITVNLAGEPLAQSLVDKLYDAGIDAVNDLYGPSEDTTYSTWTRRLHGGSANIGQPIDGTEAVILDEVGIQVPQGVVGQLYLAGAGLSRGYWQQQALTEAAFSQYQGRRFYRTGDLVKLNDDGQICYLGRVDHQVKLRGFRIELGEIEAVLRRHPQIKEAVVIAKDNQLLAYLVADALTIEQARNWLEQSLPSYMVPNGFMLLAQLPLTANGKLDRKALPPMTLDTDHYRAPSNEIEQQLCQLWQQVLGREHIGIDDNFFSIGGDSIQSIQLISRAAQQGLYFSAEDLFTHQSIARLALVVKSSRTSLPQLAQPQSNRQTLLPIQQRFIDGDSTDQHHYNQSILLDVAASFTFDWLPILVKATFDQQAVLRLRFNEQASHYVPFEADMVDNSIEKVDLTEVVEADLTAAITQHCQQQQQGFDLANGPLFKAVYFQLADQANKLLLVAHHLIVDGVSWRILLQQWQLGVEQLQQQQAVEFTPVVHSYQQWGEQLQQWAQSDECVADKAYWQQQLNTEVAALPTDLPTVESIDVSAKTEQQTKQVKLQLSSEHSQMLLQQCDSAYHTQINDLLLCGLAIALQRFSGHSDFRIALESHGRHQLLPQQLDIASTMGWFTNLFPQLLSLDEVDDVGAAIIAVKEQLAATPHFGMSYGLLDIDRIEPQVLFNYLGQATLPADSVFSLCEQEFDSQMISPNRRAEFPLSFNGMIKDNRLNFVIDYDQSLFKQTSVERLANDYQQALQQIIEHCVSQTTSRFTPSDFPLAQVDDEQLVQLQLQYHGLVDLYAATPVQQGMLFHSKMHADAYVVQLQISLQGPLDLTQFKQAWQLVVKRHAVMRTAFVAEDQLQLVHQQVELNWQQLDWRDVADFSQQLSQWCIDDKAQGFAHDVAPLMRWCTMQINENRHVLVWSAHHALIDGWSLPVVFEEVLQAYHLLLNHQPVDLLPAAVYRHYIAWLSQQDKAQAEQFWQQYLAPVESQTQLMLHQQGLADAANAENQEISLQLAANQAKALLTLAQQHQVTLNTLIQGAWAYLLHRYSNETVVCFGETVSGRPAQLPMVERMVGLFINSLPVRVDFSEPDLTLSNLLKQLHVDARERDNYGYLSLTDIQKLSALGNSSALFDSLLVFENYPIDQTMQADSSIQITDVVGDDQTNYGLTLVVMPQADEQLKFMLNYRSDKFAADMANQLLTSFVAVLTDMLAGTDTVAELNVIAANELQLSYQYKEQQYKPTVEHPSSLLVHQLFEQRAAIKPDAFVAYCEGRRLTYGELNRLANQLARRLVASGLQANQVVGLCVKRSVDILVGMLAILKAGGGYLPLDPVYPQARLDHMVQDAKVQHLVIESDLLDCVSHDNCDVLLLDDYDSRRMLDDSNIAPQTIGLAPNHLAYVIYTSGSTGQPKGVMIEHQAIAIHTKLWAEHIELQPQDKVIQFASISFDGAPESIFSSLYAGSELFLRENVLWSSADFYQYCQQHQITVADLPPAFALNWLQTHSSDSEYYWRDSQLRLLCLGGDVLNLEIVRHLKHLGSRCRLVNAYGPTEATVTATTYELTGHDYDTSVPIGTALAERELYILDDAGRLMPPNTIGELYIGGDCLARGYLNQPQLTDERFVPDLFVKKAAARMYKTGDLVARAADGNLVFYGRCDGQVKVRGYRVELSEVEAVVLGHEHVEQAAVIYHQPTGQLVSYVSCHDNAPNDPQTWLRTELAESMPAHMVPALIYPVTQMPLTVSGKIDRKALPEPQSLALSRPYVAPEGETEQTLAQIFADLLGEPRVSATDSFFDIGGHSLLLGQLAAQLSQTFGLEVGIRDLYERQTIRAIAEWLDTEILLLGGLFADDDSEHDDETQTWEI